MLVAFVCLHLLDIQVLTVDHLHMSAAPGHRGGACHRPGLPMGCVCDFAHYPGILFVVHLERTLRLGGEWMVSTAVPTAAGALHAAVLFEQ